jgi:predicted ArsR family transcriptional regulator
MKKEIKMEEMEKEFEMHEMEEEGELFTFLNEINIQSDIVIRILDFILKNDSTYKQEIAKKLNIKYNTILYNVQGLIKDGILSETLIENEKTGKPIRKINILIDKDKLQKIVKNIKKSKKTIHALLEELKQLTISSKK